MIKAKQALKLAGVLIPFTRENLPDNKMAAFSFADTSFSVVWFLNIFVIVRLTWNLTVSTYTSTI